MRWIWHISRDYQGIDLLPLRLTALPPRSYNAGSWETKSGEEACHRCNLFGRHAVKVRYCRYSRNRKRINSRVSKCNQVLGRCSIRKISSISSRNCLETCLTSVQRYCRSSWPLRSRRLCKVRPQISGGKCGRDDMMRTLDG